MWKTSCTYAITPSPEKQRDRRPSTPTPPHPSNPVSREVINLSLSSDSDDSDSESQTCAVKKMLLALAGEKRTNKKKITKTARYVAIGQKVTVEFDQTHNLDLLNFFVKRKMKIPDFVKSVYDCKNH